MISLNRKLRVATATAFIFFCSCFASYKIAYFVAETFFFDKLFYKKSIKHGYWAHQKDKKVVLEDFGKRSEDLKILKDYGYDYYYKDIVDFSRILGAKRDEIFKIVVIGDSYVWGAGIKDRDRFVNLLEKGLDKLKPTIILSFGGSGDSFVDNYIKYLLSESIYDDIDLYIFAFVENDLIFNYPNAYNQFVADWFVKSCSNDKPVFTSKYGSMNRDEYESSLEKSFSPKYNNLCIYKERLKKFPKTRAIYLDFGKYFTYPGKNYRDVFVSELMKTQLDVITVTPNDFWGVGNKPKYRKLYVSEKDGHPSSFANGVFANVLYKEITNNAKYGFFE